TAKPDMEERQGIVHHMIDIVNPMNGFSVAEYVKMAHEVISDITKRGKNAIVVGGTGLYINSLVNDVDFGENDNDMSVREELEELSEEKGIDYLVNMLLEFDPVSAQKIHKNNAKRIIRAIEFYRLTGVPISEHQAETKKKESRYNPCMLAIRWDMQKLYERIEKRVDIMAQNGLVDEVLSLLKMGCTPDMLSMQGIGYKEILEHLSGSISLEEAYDKIKLNTRHYAKRQMTWFRRDERINWIDYDTDILNNARKILDAYFEGES
ncbi:MAG: tRNA (adenosine(37)-N6)-dimethylallyltransferase MiaA, partial [Clostridia bacterium]|nr:tRNA (adenosine(37)-N6)-dimethylallyltransferase MiaA [Clostridia bacterium]